MAYDGTRYAGFQVQPNAPTVQGELERALETICGEQVRIAGAGRTDAGVHAVGQVISFRTLTSLDPASIGRGVNALLPADIATRDVEENQKADARSEITLALRIDTSISPVMEYFEIFLPRMILSNRSADRLGATYRLVINETHIL